jgi:ABC-type antimicrobial peptide transport system permease subunit
MDELVADSIGETRFTLSVLAIFAGAAALLAFVGLYGTLAYLIAQRSREFGIRLALGATASGVVGMVVREGVLLAGAGSAIGLVGARLLTGAMREMIYGVVPWDGVTLGGVILLVALVSIAAAAAPAWRASRIDPQMALRSE